MCQKEINSALIIKRIAACAVLYMTTCREQLIPENASPGRSLRKFGQAREECLLPPDGFITLTFLVLRDPRKL